MALGLTGSLGDASVCASQQHPAGTDQMLCFELWEKLRSVSSLVCEDAWEK